MGRNILGLHTEKEQTNALVMAHVHHALGINAFNRGDLAGFAYEIGYLKAIADLAKEEGAEDLNAQVMSIVADLDSRMKDFG